MDCCQEGEERRVVGWESRVWVHGGYYGDPSAHKGRCHGGGVR